MTWADAVREATRLGADERTAQALAAGAGTAVAAAVGGGGARAGPADLVAAAARRPAYVVLLADRDGAAVIAHAAGDQLPGRRFRVGARPGAPRDPHPDRPPAERHGERHVTDSEPESGGQRNAGFIAARAAIDAVANLIASSAEGPDPAAVRGVEAVAEQLAAKQVAVLLVASGISSGGDAAPGYRIGSDPAELFAAESGDSGEGTPVPLDDGLVWAALHQDAIIAQLPESTGPLAADPAAALLRRGRAS